MLGRRHYDSSHFWPDDRYNLAKKKKKSLDKKKIYHLSVASVLYSDTTDQKS